MFVVGVVLLDVVCSQSDTLFGDLSAFVWSSRVRKLEDFEQPITNKKNISIIYFYYLHFFLFLIKKKKKIN